MAPEIRDTYGLPRKTPGPFRQFAAMIVIPALIVLGWLLLPDSPGFVALLALFTVLAVGAGIAWVLRSRVWSDQPGRNPTQPPSTRGV